MLKNKFLLGCVLAGSVMASCNKEDGPDVRGDKDIKFFTNNESLGNAPTNSRSYAVVNIPDPAGTGLQNLSTTLPAAIKFPVMATRPVSQEVVIGAELDNSLVAAYNAANNTAYLEFPAGVLTTTSLSARIPKDATSSVDSITIPADLTKLSSLTGKSYMAPIKLTTVSNNGAGIIAENSTSRITYIIANVEQRRIKYLAVAADAIGALIPRAGWEITFNPAPTTAGNVLDGSTSTFSRWGVSTVDVDVNMQSVKNMTGLRLYTSNNVTYSPTQVDVSVSTDGITYDLVGSPLRANLTYASSYNYILFYKPIQAKYVRLRLSYSTSTNTQNRRLTELDVYAN